MQNRERPPSSVRNVGPAPAPAAACCPCHACEGTAPGSAPGGTPAGTPPASLAPRPVPQGLAWVRRRAIQDPVHLARAVRQPPRPQRDRDHPGELAGETSNRRNPTLV